MNCRCTPALIWMASAAGSVSVPSQVAAASSQLRSGMEGAIHFIESGKARPAVLFVHGLTQGGGAAFHHGGRARWS